MSSTRKARYRAWLPWLFITASLLAAVTLGFLQYRWIGEVSTAERERLRAGLQTSLERFAIDCDSVVGNTLLSLIPPRLIGGEEERESDYAKRVADLRASITTAALVKRVLRAVPDKGALALEYLDESRATFVPTTWPEAWSRLHDRLTSKIASQSSTTPPPRGPFTRDFADVVEIPIFYSGPRGGPPREAEWLIVELDLQFLSDSLFQELLRRHLAPAGDLEYSALIRLAEQPEQVVFRSGQLGDEDLADASTRFFNIDYPEIGHPRAEASKPPGRGQRRIPEGRYLISIRHQSGSLEALVARSRQRNLAITTVLISLLVAALVAISRSTRQAQRLAQLQMQFVAGVSHELRTPLTVMRTAGHNLKNKRMALEPIKAEQYGSLIEKESEKLAAIVDQILRFAGTRSGSAVVRKEPVEIAEVVGEALQTTRESTIGWEMDIQISPRLPPVLGDRASLTHVLQNLIDNAVKYGGAGSYLSITASEVNQRGPAIEIRVRDRGDGIAAADLKHVFEPFYRGQVAVDSQIHGTGLGLSLVQKIVEAHGGSVRMRSTQGKGTEVVITLPASDLPVSTEMPVDA